ncbi:MAG TPA: thioredoxin domain-containing protein [Polyangiaceae bacterium]
MQRARVAQAPSGVLGLFALWCALGSIACSAPQSSQAAPHSGQIDLTSPGGPGWPVLEPEPEAAPLTDADVERIATRIPRQRVPRVSVQSPSKGPDSAKVVLQIFSDFECPFCVRVAATLDDVEARFHGRLRLVWRNYPLPSHARARPAARAALCAFELGGSAQFWKLHDYFYSPAGDLSDAGLRRAATKLGLDATRIEQAASSTSYDSRLDADMAAGDAAGIEGTPAAFINDYYLMGARSEAEYAVVIERALREAG